MRVLITGAAGLLGSHLVKTAWADDEIIGTYYTDPGKEKLLQLDIMDRDLVRGFLKQHKPDTVIHCAAESRVDYVEQNNEEGWRVNVDGTENLAWDATHFDCHFVHISSNAVFRGDKAPYAEYSHRDPANYYGMTKLGAEMVVQKYRHKRTIIRPIMLYGWQRRGKRDYLVSRILNSLRQGEKVQAATDIISQPTDVFDCAAAIWTIVHKQENREEIVNLAPPESMSLYEFAIEVAMAFGLDKNLIVPVKAASFKNLAPRPLNTCYDTRKLKDFGIRICSPMDGLRRMRLNENVP